MQAHHLRLDENGEFTSFRYLSDGSTDLPPSTKVTAGGATLDDDSWYITLLGLNDDGKDISTVNFFTVQIDPDQRHH